MRSWLTIFFAFVAFTLIGCTAIEFARISAARTIGYHGEFYAPMGRYFFSSSPREIQFREMQAAFQFDYDAYSASPGWDLLVDIDSRDHAVIEAAGIVLALAISAIGFLIIARRKKSRPFTIRHLTGAMMSLFFMRQVILSGAMLIIGDMPCNEAKLWSYLGMPIHLSQVIIVLVGLTGVACTLRLLPKNILVPFVSMGIPGAAIGAAIWIALMGIAT